MSTQFPTHSKRVHPRSPLTRILGLGFGVAVIFGGTVGVGILRLPGTIAGELRSFWLILAIWTAGALYALLGAISLSSWVLPCHKRAAFTSTRDEPLGLRWGLQRAGR